MSTGVCVRKSLRKARDAPFDRARFRPCLATLVRMAAGLLERGEPIIKRCPCSFSEQRSSHRVLNADQPLVRIEPSRILPECPRRRPGNFDDACRSHLLGRFEAVSEEVHALPNPTGVPVPGPRSVCGCQGRNG